MLRRVFVLLVFLATGAVAHAADQPTHLVGLYLTTPYPSLEVRPGETTTVDLTLHNFNKPPQQLALAVPDIAKGWKATFLGGGQPISAAIVSFNQTQQLQLRLKPPKEGGPGEYHFLVEAHGGTTDLRLPLTLTVRKGLPAKLKLTTELPGLRGPASAAFKFKVKIANDSGHDATVDFNTDTPKGFQVTYTEAYGTQQITSMPIKAGQSKEIQASVALPHDTRAGTYRILFHAKSEVASATLPLYIAVIGRPRLALTGEGGRLSGEGYAGTSTPLTLVLRNQGSAAAHVISFDASAPDGWKARFEPKKLAALAPGQVARVKLLFTPSQRAIAGDYQMTVSANAAGDITDSENFRITVLTSTLWGAVGIGIIAAALLVVVFAVARFGRR